MTQTTTNKTGLKDVWREVERLIRVNADHRKGFRTADVKPEFIIDQAEKEFKELKDEMDRYVLCMVGSDRDVAIELGDLIGVLIHFAIKMGYTEESLSLLILDKFKKRFDG